MQARHKKLAAYIRHQLISERTIFNNPLKSNKQQHWTENMQ